MWKHTSEPKCQNESIIASGVFILHLRTHLLFIKKTKGKLMSQYHSLSFRKWPNTHCQIISRGEGITALYLRINTVKTCVTFLVISCFPLQHRQIYPRSWHWVISSVPVLHRLESCRKKGHVECIHVSDEPLCCPLLSIWHSSTPGSTSPFTCVHLAPALRSSWLDVTFLF